MTGVTNISREFFTTCQNKSGLCQCGCGQPTTISRVTDRCKGYLRGCPRRYLNGHAGVKSALPYLEDEQGCWIWQRTRNEQGYGRTRDGKKMRLAHRTLYEREFGAVPHGTVLHHLCGRGHLGCVNPRHMKPVKPSENARLGRAAKLRHDQVSEIRRLFEAGGHTKASLARQFGVSDVQIHYIISGRCWLGD